MKPLTAAVVVFLAGCATTAQRQYEEAHARYLEQSERVSALEQELRAARESEDEIVAAAVQNALADARTQLEEAQKIRSETRDDANRERESNHAFWLTAWATLAGGLKALEGLAKAAKEVVP